MEKFYLFHENEKLAVAHGIAIGNTLQHTATH